MLVVTPEGQPATDWWPVIEQGSERNLSDLAPHNGPLVVLSAHPDDETIGAGRLISAWARTVGPVAAVSMSSGEACVQHLGVHIPYLADVRRAEFRAATAELGVQQALCWSLPDSGIGQYLPYVADGLSALIDGAAAVAAPWRYDPHPDHAALGTVAATLCGGAGIPLLEYPVWSSFWQRPEDAARNGYRVVRVAVSDEDTANRKRALAHYRSQLLPLRPDLTAVVPASMLEHHQVQFYFELIERPTAVPQAAVRQREAR